MELVMQTYDNVDEASWDSALKRLNGPIKHSTGWACFRKKTSGMKPLFISGNLNISEKNSRQNPFENSVIMALCFIEQSSKPLISTLSRSVIVESFPAVSDNNADILTKGILWIEGYCKKMNFRNLVFESSQSPLSFHHIPQAGYQLEKRFEFILDLTFPVEELWKQMKDSHRRKIRSIEKFNISADSQKNIQIIDSDDSDDLMKLRELQENSAVNAEERGQAFSLADKNQYILIKEYLLEKKLAKLFLTISGRDIISGALITTFHKKCYYMYGGSNQKGFELSSSYFQFWEMLKQLKNEGFNEFNFGGVPVSAEKENSPSHGLYRFKRGYNTRIETCIGGSKVLSPIKDRLYKLIKS